jgi:hypothetical protein
VIALVTRRQLARGVLAARGAADPSATLGVKPAVFIHRREAVISVLREPCQLDGAPVLEAEVDEAANAACFFQEWGNRDEVLRVRHEQAHELDRVIRVVDPEV